ncbi:lysophospholipid acyltransferase family protein [Sphaerothrix gracilis]|uniref:lysophospholipid acyltransferase family protein n=1 Tax=Sphaerothrix gracilis TaxID=3151835 RepID=UPI0031FE102D
MPSKLDFPLQSAVDLANLLLQASLTAGDRFTGWSLEDRDPQVIEQLLPFFGWFYENYFRVQTDGWQHIPQDEKVLLIGSHNGGLAAPDTVMMTYDWCQRFGSARPVYALMEPKMWQVFPGVARLAAQVGAVQARPQMAIAALEAGANVLIYPGGVQDVFRPYSLRHQIHFGNSQGFIKLALDAEVPIVPLISYGAHSTLVILADVYPQLQRLHRAGVPWPLGIDPGTCPIYLGLPWGLAVGPLPNIPLPVRLHTRVCPPIVFERYGQQAARDRDYVQRCYHQVVSTMQRQLDQLVQEEETRD